MFAGFVVNGQDVFTVSEANSSPSSVTAAKGGSVWLHWNYTYLGDGKHGGVTTTFKHQVVALNSTFESIIKTLANKTGSNGALTLESPVPAPFNGRVEVISANSTLAIHSLQYNDSIYQLLSYVTLELDIGVGAFPKRNDLKPVVSITVNGMRTCCILLCCDIN